DARPAPLPPVGLELPADLINAAGQVKVQAAGGRAGVVTHRDSVLGPRSIGCGGPETACRGQSTKNHLELDNRGYMPRCGPTRPMGPPVHLCPGSVVRPPGAANLARPPAQKVWFR